MKFAHFLGFIPLFFPLISVVLITLLISLILVSAAIVIILPRPFHRPPVMSLSPWLSRVIGCYCLGLGGGGGRKGVEVGGRVWGLRWGAGFYGEGREGMGGGVP